MFIVSIILYKKNIDFIPALQDFMFFEKSGNNERDGPGML